MKKKRNRCDFFIFSNFKFPKTTSFWEKQILLFWNVSSIFIPLNEKGWHSFYFIFKWRTKISRVNYINQKKKKKLIKNLIEHLKKELFMYNQINNRVI